MQLYDIALDLTKQLKGTVNCLISHTELTVEVMPGELILLCELLKASPYCFAQLIDLSGVDYLHYKDTDTDTDIDIDADNDKNKNNINDDKDGCNKPRFAVVYHLLSLVNSLRIRIKCYCYDYSKECYDNSAKECCGAFIQECCGTSAKECCGEHKNSNITQTQLPTIPSVSKIWSSANWYEREAYDLFGIVFDGHPDLQRILLNDNFKGHALRKDFPLIGKEEVYYDADAQQIKYRPVTIEGKTSIATTSRKINTISTDYSSGKSADCGEIANNNQTNTDPGQ